MIQIRSIEQANQVLAGYMPQVKEMLGKDITLTRMIPLMSMLGNPQYKLKIIHIAGTSGKTSAAYYVASLLKQAGKRVGLTVSPHIDSVTERVQIDLEPLNTQEFCSSLEQFMELVKGAEPSPTYFELLVALAYWYFAKAGVDYAVIETGLGGLQDASNVANKSDKICVITDIGHDHMHVLGDTLSEISEQKSGIIHSGNQVFMYKQTDEINQVVQAQTQKQNAILNMLSETDERNRAGDMQALKLLPLYQQRNWLLARHVFEYIQRRDNLPELAAAELVKSMQVQVPGRMDVRTIQAKTLIMDGAHNDQKMKAFVASFQAAYPAKKAAIVIALKAGKEYETVLPQLLPICSSLIITTFDVLQDLPSKSIDPEILAEAAHTYGFTDVNIVTNPVDAYRELLQCAEDILIITGSFYLLSCIRPAIMESQ